MAISVLFHYIAIHRKPHTVLRRLAVQMRTVFGDAPCLKLSVDGYKSPNGFFAGTSHKTLFAKLRYFLNDKNPAANGGIRFYGVPKK